MSREGRSDCTDGQTDTSTLCARNREISSLKSRISARSYRLWSDEQAFKRNIRQGKPWRNNPAPVTPPNRHSPSQLQQCHRKIFYRQLNAPEESSDPDGIFWSGTKFEEERMMPYLESLVDGDAYIRNSMWVDFEVESVQGPLQIRGATDPVIVDAQSVPLVVTEIKTKQSVDYLTEPNRHHVAQLHAYMEGLSREWETEVREAVLIYGSRTTLDIRVFPITFGQETWRELVVGWANKHTAYRSNDELPPKQPVFDWECGTCSYKHRCGKGDSRFSDMGADGFLSLFGQYPEEKVVAYLNGNEEARLTPTLAKQFPELAKEYSVCDWRCQRCGTTFEFLDVTWDGDVEEPPLCASCGADGVPVPLVEMTTEESC